MSPSEKKSGEVGTMPMSMDKMAKIVRDLERLMWDNFLSPAGGFSVVLFALLLIEDAYVGDIGEEDAKVGLLSAASRLKERLDVIKHSLTIRNK